jgi:hypothetical protein
MGSAATDMTLAGPLTGRLAMPSYQDTASVSRLGIWAMPRFVVPLLASLLAVVAACDGMRSRVEVANDGAAAYPAPAPRNPAEILLTEADLTGSRYQDLGAIRVRLSKNDMFGEDPTRAMVEQELREKAAEIGADAVAGIRYGELGVTITSWGSIAAEGRAVRFLAPETGPGADSARVP